MSRGPWPLVRGPWCVAPGRNTGFSLFTQGPLSLFFRYLLTCAVLFCAAALEPGTGQGDLEPGTGQGDLEPGPASVALGAGIVSKLIISGSALPVRRGDS